MALIAIDPGNVQSAYVRLTDSLDPRDGVFGKEDNNNLLKVLEDVHKDDEVVIEMVACYGMPVGEEIFETVYWIGKYAMMAEYHGATVTRIKRQAVKLHLCHDSRAKDGNVIQALKDRFGGKGTKAAPGWFYQVGGDVWQAYGLAIAYSDTRVQARDGARG